MFLLFILLSFFPIALNVSLHNINTKASQNTLKIYALKCKMQMNLLDEYARISNRLFRWPKLGLQSPDSHIY